MTTDEELGPDIRLARFARFPEPPAAPTPGRRGADGQSEGRRLRCETGEPGKSGESENLPSCASRRRGGARDDPASAPEWFPLQQSRDGHGRPCGRPARCASGAREVRSLGVAA
jgi:hypothetical protein